MLCLSSAVIVMRPQLIGAIRLPRRCERPASSHPTHQSTSPGPPAAQRDARREWTHEGVGRDEPPTDLSEAPIVLAQLKWRFDAPCRAAWPWARARPLAACVHWHRLRALRCARRSLPAPLA